MVTVPRASVLYLPLQGGLWFQQRQRHRHPPAQENRVRGGLRCSEVQPQGATPEFFTRGTKSFTWPLTLQPADAPNSPNPVHISTPWSGRCLLPEMPLLPLSTWHTAILQTETLSLDAPSHHVNGPLPGPISLPALTPELGRWFTLGAPYKLRGSLQRRGELSHLRVSPFHSPLLTPGLAPPRSGQLLPGERSCSCLGLPARLQALGLVRLRFPALSPGRQPGGGG